MNWFDDSFGNFSAHTNNRMNWFDDSFGNFSANTISDIKNAKDEAIRLAQEAAASAYNGALIYVDEKTSDVSESNNEEIDKIHKRIHTISAITSGLSISIKEFPTKDEMESANTATWQYMSGINNSIRIYAVEQADNALKNAKAYSDSNKASVFTSATTYAEGLGKNYDKVGSAASALTDAKTYAFNLGSNYDSAGAADAALSSAKAHAEGLGKNYDKAGSAASALTDAKAYSDSNKATVFASATTYADGQAQSAIDLAKNYTDIQAQNAIDSATTYTDDKTDGVVTQASLSRQGFITSAYLADKKYVTEKALTAYTKQSDLEVALSAYTKQSDLEVTLSAYTKQSEFISLSASVSNLKFTLSSGGTGGIIHP